MLGVRNGLTGEPDCRPLRTAARDVARNRLRCGQAVGSVVEYLIRDCGFRTWEAVDLVDAIMKELSP